MSAIIGDGYGSSHDWEYLGSNDSRVSLYACRNCHAHFYHAYDRIPNIFDAMYRENVANECPNRSPDDAKCFDCDRQYGDKYGFPDLIIPLENWKRISPTGDEGGLLCPSCICKRLHDAGISNVPAAFMSGPITSVGQTEMHTLRRVENLELRFNTKEPADGT